MEGGGLEVVCISSSETRTASINRVTMSVWPHEEQPSRAVLPYLGCNTGGAVNADEGCVTTRRGGCKACT